MILLIDNFDSFVHNLARYLRRLGQPTRVVRNDDPLCLDLGRLRPNAVVISPGPCAPAQAGLTLEAVRRWANQIPMLGVCLGHQAIAEACGGRVVRAPRPLHGQTSEIRHLGSGLFAGLPERMVVGRYHSLCVDPGLLPACFEANAWSEDGVIMGIRHRAWPLFGVQFHPESVLTEHGFELLTNFLRQAGICRSGPIDVPTGERPTVAMPPPLPSDPVTF